MRFGPLPVAEALGAVVAHAIRSGSVVLKKGDRISAAHVAALQQEGIGQIVVALEEPDDVSEDVAAQRLAARFGGAQVRLDPPFTGRVNLFARCAGLVRVNGAAVLAANSIDEAITVATLPDLRMVAAGEMVATVKIIPFAVESRHVAQAEQVGPLVEVVPFQPFRVGVISTLLPGLKPGVVRKTLRVMAKRLEPMQASVAREVRVLHEVEDLAFALGDMARQHDLIIVFGASAITDRRDVIPAAIEAAGGEIIHFGMPVDPGNLLLLGQLGGAPVLGAPGCARSPKDNGFDWILQRLMAGLTVTPQDIRALGVGGLLMEIGTRPQPRLEQPNSEQPNSEQPIGEQASGSTDG